MTIRFTLNGRPVSIEASGDRCAVDLLREDLGLIGIKEACEAGGCGVCAIVVDGQSSLSCLMLAAQLEGRAVTTIEGQAPGERLHPLQEAFAQAGAVQCGFCTPWPPASCSSATPIPAPKKSVADSPATSVAAPGTVKIVEAVQLAADRMNKGQA